MHINPDSVSARDVYKLLTSTVTPRPIAWVSSMDQEGIVNLAPFSFFNVVSVSPPVLGFSPLIGGDGERKDTLKNIEATKMFVVNIVSASMAEKMSQTSAPYASDINEMAEVGLTPMTSSEIAVPCVAEALVHYECTLHDIVSFGDQALAGNLVLGRICHIHIRDEIYNSDRVDVAQLDTVGRMEGGFYTTTKDRFEIERPVLKNSTTGH